MKKIIFIVLAIVIVAGIAITATIGLNVDIMYKAHEQINVYVGKEANIKEIEDIAKEVLGKQKFKLVAITEFNDTFAISTESVSDEQVETLKQKVGEKYSIEDTSKSVVKLNIPKLKLRDLIRPYITPIIVSTVIIAVFMAIRFKNIGVMKVFMQLILMLSLACALLISLLALTRCPINQYVVPGAVAIYFATLITLNIQNLNEGPNVKDKYHIRMKFFGAILILYFLFMIISTAFPKKIEDKYDIKEYERRKKERESDDEDNDNNIDNINNEDYNDSYNLFKINNDEDKPPAEIIASSSKENNKKSSSLNNSKDYAISENNKSNAKEEELINDKNDKDSKPLINFFILKFI